MTHKATITQTKGITMPPLLDELTPLIATWEDCWNRLEPTKLRDWWDPDEINPYYVAEEITDPMFSWDEIMPYWQEAESILAHFSVRTWDHHCKLVGSDLASMQIMMHWNAVLAGPDPTPFGLDVRVSALARKISDTWLFCQWIESPVGALPYIKSRYTSNVDPEFLAAIAH